MQLNGMNCPNHVFVNQNGYRPCDKKQAILPFEAESFRLETLDGTLCMEGKPAYLGLDENSQDTLWAADFSAWQKNGQYRIVAGNEKSAAFPIGDSVHQPLMEALTRAFYYLRCGMELQPAFAGEFVHAACHRGISQEWDDHSVCKEIYGGWHDAGDYGRYVTAGACALSHMLYAFKLFPRVFEKLDMNIPESGSPIPDFLSECRYELEWMLQMQREDGSVYHKQTTAQHAPFVMPEEDGAQMYLLPVSSIAVADLCAICALASGIYRPYDGAFADRLYQAALLSYQWLKQNPDFVDFRNPPGCGTGGYYESNDYSNRFWCSAELYALTGEKTYHDDLVRAMEERFPRTELGYGEVGGFALLAYLFMQQEKDASLEQAFREAFQKEAIRLQKLSVSCGYGAAMSQNDYIWGSNMVLMKHAMTFAIVDRLNGDTAYMQDVRRQFDYLLGVNPFGISYVTGIGEFCCNYPHLRPSSTDGIERCIPGYVSGGPNRRPADPDAKRLVPEGTPPMKCYVDVDGSYSLNEITIYWNSPAVFALAYLMDC